MTIFDRQKGVVESLLRKTQFTASRKVRSYDIILSSTLLALSHCVLWDSSQLTRFIVGLDYFHFLDRI